MKNKIALFALFLGLGVYGVMPAVNGLNVFGATTAFASDRSHDGGSDHDGNDHSAGAGGGGDDDGHDDNSHGSDDNGMGIDTHDSGNDSSHSCKSLACMLQ